MQLGKGVEWTTHICTVLALLPEGRGLNVEALAEFFEVPMPAFRCTEIRQNGPCALKPKDCKRPCEVASAFAKAEAVYREALNAQTLASVMQEAAVNSTPEHMLDIVGWVQRQIA